MIGKFCAIFTATGYPCCSLFLKVEYFSTETEHTFNLLDELKLTLNEKSQEMGKSNTG